MIGRIRENGTAHWLLSVACAEPLGSEELFGRVTKRVHCPVGNSSIDHAIAELCKRGLLRETQVAKRGQKRQVVVTAEGEETLNAMGLPTEPSRTWAALA